MSTNHYNIDGPRSSSRVLRPPGGSYTDILGVKEENNAAVKNTRGSSRSEISDCFQFDLPHKPEQPKEKKDEAIEKNGNENSKPQESENTNNDKNETSAPQRVRVPPGGFSSGLW